MNVKRFLEFVARCVDCAFSEIQIRSKAYEISQCPHIDPSVKFGKGVNLIGPRELFYIGAGTYINDGIISTGEGAEVRIGKNCAIGYRVSIKALTHDPARPCFDELGNIAVISKSIFIGDNCWIGDNVFIKEGVVLGDDVIVGAGSIVTRSFPSNVVIAGVPARVLKQRTPSPS